MRIHTDILKTKNLWEAMQAAKKQRLDMDPVFLEYATSRGSRTHARAITFRLASDGGPGRKRRQNTGKAGADFTHAASWDDHGHWMAQVYEIDPKAIFSFAGATSPNYVVYRDREHFHEATEGAYLIA